MSDYLDKKLQAVSDMIIAKLEKLEHPEWRRPWINIGGGLPRNISGRYYSGSNLLFLSLLAEEGGYKAPIYLTFLQAKEAGLQIKKGERSFPAFYHNISITDKAKNKIDIADYKSLTKEEQKECNVKSFLRAYDVFNIDQTNMLQIDPEQYAAITNSTGIQQRNYHNEALSSMIENNAWVCPIEFHGNKAYYSVPVDKIVSPRMEQFNSQEEFFATLLHEMSHSTGHEQRLNRDLGMVSDTVFRAREELIAEISSAMSGMKLGVQKEISNNNLAYIKSWISEAKQDNKFVYKAIVDAAKSADYITQALGIKNELDEKIAEAQQLSPMRVNAIDTQLHREYPTDAARLDAINSRFNEELQRQIDGTLPKGHTYKLGNAGEILQSASIPSLPIELQASRLTDKSMQENHPFNLSEVKDLPKAIQNPMAVFRSATHIGSYVIMTEIEHEGKNYVVALQANKRKGNIEINDIRSVHYRRTNAHIANWIDEGLLEYADKKRMSEWLSKQRYNSAEVRQLFGRAAKIIQNFENPKLLDTKNQLNNKNMENLEKWEVYHPKLRDPNTSAETLAKLAEVKNEDLYVLLGVAEHPNTSAETLAKLAKINKDKDLFVHQSVAEHPNTSAETLAKLVKDKKVPIPLSKNPKTPAKALTELAKEALTNLMKNPDLESSSVTVCDKIAIHPNTPIETLAELASVKNYANRMICDSIRKNVANNPNTPAEVLAKLANESLTLLAKYPDAPDISICKSVALHPNTPIETLTKLAENEDKIVSRMAERKIEEVNPQKDHLNNKNMESTKSYVGNSYKTVTEKGTFYNFEVKKEAIEKIDGIGKRNEVMIAIEPKKEVKEKHPTHSLYVSDKHTKRELQLVVSKDELLKAPVDEYGNINAFAASREKIGADLSNYSVALEQKDPETGKYQFIGRGYDETAKFGETRVMGTAIKTPLDEYGTNSAKVYNVSLDANKVGKLTVNEYGDARLGIVPYSEKVFNPDDSLSEQTRYLVTEATSATKGVEATIAVHVSNPEGKNYPTLDSCAVHKVGENEVYKLVVQDRKSESIGKDCADLTVSENKYTPEMKDLPEVERKAALADKNYVGKGWTNDPDKIRIDHKNELKPEGLTKAIDNNHTVKVMAILNKQPAVVRESHLKQLEARNKEGLKTSSVIESRVKQIFSENTIENKQKKNSGLRV